MASISPEGTSNQNYTTSGSESQNYLATSSSNENSYNPVNNLSGPEVFFDEGSQKFSSTRVVQGLSSTRTVANQMLWNNLPYLEQNNHLFPVIRPENIPDIDLDFTEDVAKFINMQEEDADLQEADAEPLYM